MKMYEQIPEELHQYVLEYAHDVTSDEVYLMDDLPYLLEGKDPEEIFNIGHSAYGYPNIQNSFMLNDDYIIIDGYGRFASATEWLVIDYVVDNANEYIQWCKDQGYYDAEE